MRTDEASKLTRKCIANHGPVEECNTAYFIRVACDQAYRLPKDVMERNPNVYQCPNCGKSLTNIIAFCKDCGQKLRWKSGGV